MYEPPDTKAIRRSDLASSSSRSNTPSRSPSPETIARQQSQLASLFSTSTSVAIGELQDHSSAPDPSSQQPTHKPPNAASDEEDAVPFRLFSNTTSTSPPRIRLRSPSLGPGSFLHARPSSYYFHSPGLSHTLAAISGAEIKRISRRPWPGTAIPWRTHTVRLSRRAVRKLDAAPPKGMGRLPSHASEGHDAEAGASLKRKTKAKPGKKRRLVLRMRARAAESAEAQRVKDDEEKQAADRLKRAKRNREKKAKKVAREKAKKASASAAGAGPMNTGAGAAGVVAEGAEVKDGDRTEA